ncbi:thioredoxin family protein [Colwellia sp. BRX10-3]|uniref:thioredoxin family protein n=1 Tax=Colwellia sp. BRX10-3 TaxID=2759844 RepID=UPI0015F5E9B4|nr:thioredoxin family protein [Colwellia sp. BRX10-3]MBA6390930.1 thioredoxin family protein [Colwellia sp. BRX10-3]
MKEIKVLGTGCAKCTKSVEVITKIANELNIEVHITKVIDPEVIMAYSVMTTPTIIVDEINVHSGSIPHREAIIRWLKG